MRLLSLFFLRDRPTSRCFSAVLATLVLINATWVFAEPKASVDSVLGPEVQASPVTSQVTVVDSSGIDSVATTISTTAITSTSPISTSIPVSTSTPVQDQSTEAASGRSGDKEKSSLTSIYSQKESPSTGSSLLSMVIGLSLVLLLIVSVAWGVRRFSSLHPAGGRYIKVLSASVVGARERLTLVEVGDKRILLGVTPHQINTLHVFAKEDIPDEQEASDFARKLQEMMSRGKSG